MFGRLPNYWARRKLAALSEGQTPMSLVARYEISCSNGHTISLTERILQEIVDNLQELDTVAPVVTFVCSQCKTAFRFDYLNRKSAGVIDEPPRSSKPFVWIVTIKCGDTRCGFPLELVAVRNSDTTQEQF